MALSFVRVKLVSSLLALTLVTFGVAPCAAMDMGHEMAAMPEHGCCEGETCPAALDEAPSAPVPLDCCALSAPADPQAPSPKAVATSAALLAPLDLPLRFIRAALDPDVTPTTEGPPAWRCVPRHLLLSVFLI
jgi:hypothetical protein